MPPQMVSPMAPVLPPLPASRQMPRLSQILRDSPQFTRTANLWVNQARPKAGLHILPNLEELRLGELPGCDAACGQRTAALIRGAIDAYARNPNDSIALWIVQGWTIYQNDPKMNQYIIGQLDDRVLVGRANIDQSFRPALEIKAQVNEQWIDLLIAEGCRDQLRGLFETGQVPASRRKAVEDFLMKGARNNAEVAANMILEMVENGGTLEQIRHQLEIILTNLLDAGDRKEFFDALTKRINDSAAVYATHWKVASHIMMLGAGLPESAKPDEALQHLKKIEIWTLYYQAFMPLYETLARELGSSGLRLTPLSPEANHLFLPQ